MTLHVVYRAAPAGGRKVRPSWFSKSLCLASFLRSLEDVPDATVRFLVDGKLPADVLDAMKQRGEIEQLDGVGNCRSYLTALTRMAATSGTDGDGVLLCEDDYLHTTPALPAIDEALTALGPGTYVTPYDHPDRYARTDDWSVPGRPVESVNGRFWRVAESTTLTYGTTLGTVRRDRLWLGAGARGTGYPHDRVMWRSLQGLGPFRPVRWVRRPARRLLSALPTLSTHCEQTELGAGVDWEDSARSARAWAVAHDVPLNEDW